MKKFAPVIRGYDHFLHGGDYNPDQWLGHPEIIDADFERMREAGCNTFSVGIFAWTSYEKREGEFDFAWLDRIMDRMAAEDHRVFLATPSGARPAWMARKYPEVLRVDARGIRDRYRLRHNHCWSSPVYRDKVADINRRLAERYAGHPALGGWHVSNEYNGSCYCDLCKARFREFLRERYGSLDALNAAWWSSFWSHTYTDWDQIEPDDFCVDALAVDWYRFNTWQIVDFMHHEVAAVREFSDAPVTTNMMGFRPDIDYWQVAGVCDFIADDRYPGWLEVRDFAGTAAAAAMCHDFHRSMKRRPWVLMESSPSNLNWQPYYRLKRPGLHRAEALLAVGHGADAVMYFQFRKGRGGSEKFHGAVVDHEGSSRTRVFRDVAEVGDILRRIAPVRGTMTEPEVAVVFDTDAWAALMASGGPSQGEKKYAETLNLHYRALWELNLPCDVIDSTADFSRYRVIVAPMLFMLKPGVAEAIRKFIADGGVWVGSYLSFYVGDSNLYFTGGLPGGGLRDVFGFWNEELDGLTPEDRQSLIPAADNTLGLSGDFPLEAYAELLHLEGARMEAGYGSDFYAGTPALTSHIYGSGTAYYQSARCGLEFLRAFYRALVARHGLETAAPAAPGFHATVREGDGERYLFVYNFNPEAGTFDLGGRSGTSLIDGGRRAGEITLSGFGSDVLRLD